MKAKESLEERMGKMQHVLKNKNLECLKCLILYLEKNQENLWLLRSLYIF